MKIFIRTYKNTFLFNKHNMMKYNDSYLIIDDIVLPLNEIYELEFIGAREFEKVLCDEILEARRILNEKRIKNKAKEEEKTKNTIELYKSLVNREKKEDLNYSYSQDEFGIIIDSPKYEKLGDLLTFLKEEMGIDGSHYYYGFIGHEEGNQYLFTENPTAFNESLKDQLYEENKGDFEPIEFISLKLKGEE